MAAELRALRGVGANRPLLAAVVLAAIAGLLFPLLGVRDPGGIHSQALRVALRVAVAIPVAALAGYIVARPWSGLVAWMTAMPLLNMAHAQIVAGSWQFLLSTLFTAALLLGWLLGRSTRPGPDAVLLRRPLAVWAWGIAGIVLVLTVVSTVLAQDVGRAIPIALHGIVEPVVVAAVAVSLRPTRSQVAALAVGLVAGVALATLVNVARMALVVRSMSSLADQRGQLGRLTYYNVGIYGDVLVMALPLTLYLALAARDLGLPRGTARAAVVCAVLFVFALYFTYSKSAWIGALVAAPLLLLVALPTWRARIAVAVAAVVVSAIVFPWPPVLLRPFVPALANSYEHAMSNVQPRSASLSLDTSEGEVSITERIRATEAGLRMAIDHPVLGVGPGGFGPEYNKGPYRDAAATRPLDSPHNLVVDLAAETGLAETTLLAIAFLAALLAGVVLWRHGDRAGRLAGGAFVASLVGFIIVATLFGVDLYRTNRLMNSDVLMAALLVALPLAARASWSSEGVAAEQVGE